MYVAIYISVASLAPVIGDPTAHSTAIINHTHVANIPIDLTNPVACVRHASRKLKCLHIRVELNSTFVLSDANAAPPPPASTPPFCIAPFSTTATIT
jgi:hypothetical protein